MRDCSDFLNSIKRIIIQVLNTEKLASFQYATVKSIQPLEIQLNQKITLSDDFIVLTEKIRNLKVGDRVVLMRNHGGQEYVVIDKVIDKVVI